MPEFNDRRPRQPVRVRVKDLQPGDHIDHGAGFKEVTQVFQPNKGLPHVIQHRGARDVSMPGQRAVTVQRLQSAVPMGPQGAMPVASTDGIRPRYTDEGRYAKQAKGLPYGPEPKGDNGGAEVRYNDAAGRRTNPLR